MTGHACLHAAGESHFYFFQGNQYALIKWTPGKTDELKGGPASFWGCLKSVGFDRIDAVLPIPNHLHRAYFFSGNRYADIEYVPFKSGDTIHAVNSIASGWPALARSRFDRVDGALSVPGKPGQAYFFSGENYCRISLEEGRNDILDGPKPIRVGWPYIRLSTNRIDTIFVRPGLEAMVYIFSGNKYHTMRIGRNGNDEAGEDRTVAEGWPSLKSAGFY